MSIRLLLVADDFLLVEKPSGLLCVPGRGQAQQDCLSSRVQAVFPEALVVHRLDRDTSGIVLLARHRRAQADLAGQFERRQVRKTYVADVAGRPVEDRGVIELPVGKDFERPPRYSTLVPWAKPCRTYWEVRRRGPSSCRLLLKPVTGRSHQLRVHLAAISHPILGDPLYGEEAGEGSRLRLHATSLCFREPGGGRRLKVDSPCPF